MQHRLCVRVQSACLQSDLRKAHLQPVLCAISLHGIRIYDSKTDEEIKIPKEISTHRQSEKTEMLDPLGKSHPAAIYERGSLSHASGAKLWYLLEREKSEQNEKKLLYVSPEERETKGSYLDYAKSVDETENSITEIYEISYVQQKGRAEGFRLTLDGFSIAAKADGDNAMTAITFLTDTPSIEVGAGYTYVQAGRTLTFTAAAPESPVYFLSPDGIKTEMYYAGGSLQAILQIPMDAVDANFAEVVPTLKFSHRDAEGGIERKTLDWFHDLSSDHTEVILKPPDGYVTDDTAQEVPKTGDAANAAGYLLLLAGAAAGLVFSTGMLRKRRKTNR